MKALLAALVAMASILLAPASLLGQQLDHLKTLMNKAEEWKKLSVHVQGTSRTETNISRNQKTTKLIDSNAFRQNGHSALVLRDYKQIDGPTENATKSVSCFNAIYGFSIHMKETGWILDELILEPPFEPKEIPTPTRKSIAGAVSVCFPWLPLSSDEFKVKKAEAKTLNNKTEFHLFADVTRHDSKKQLLYVATGVWRYDVDAGYSLISSDFESRRTPTDKNSTTISSNYSYKGKIAGFPRLVKRVSQTKSSADKGESTVLDSVTEFDYRLDSDVPDFEFTLSAFGLPEPKGVTWNRPTPLWIWYGLGGIALIAFGAWMLRRRAAKPKANPATA